MKNEAEQPKKWGMSFSLAATLLMVLGLSRPALSQVGILGDWETAINHTKESGTDRALIFIAHEESASGTPTLTSVTYGGQEMDKVIEITSDTTGGSSNYRNYVAAFILNEAGIDAATNGDFSVTWSGSTSSVGYASVFLGSVDQTDPIGDSDSAQTGSGTDPISTGPLSTAEGDMVIDAATCGDVGSYTLTGFTEGYNNLQFGGSSGGTGAAGYVSATGANVTPTANYSATVNRQVLIGFVVNAAFYDPNIAANPNPTNGASGVAVSAGLSWDAPAAYTPTSYDVYFGTNPAAHSNPKNTVYMNSYDPPGDLAEGTTYYWAVDCNDSGTIYAGDDWSFTTYEPVATGDLVADYILSQALTTYYASACSYYGVMIYSEVTANTTLKDGVIAAYPSEYYTGAQMPPEGDVDKNVYGILPFELYRQTGDANYLTAALYLADKEFENPRPDGLSEYTRFWIDDTYMIGSLQTQAYKSTADPNYIDRAVTQLLGYMGEVENLQQPNGLFYHTLSAPIHWGRGNGWVAAAMTEVLLSIPQDHPQRAQLLTKYQNMMSGLLTYQDTSGMWYQVLDMPTDPDNWLESSCTGMFVFALASGVDEGWLPEQPYKQAVLDGWAALDGYVDEQGRVHEVCTGTWADPDVQFYFDRPREIGNPHGQAAVIWAATAMERLNSTDIKGDIDGDGDVDFDDLYILTDNWLDSEPSADIAPAEGDGVIDFLDFAKLAEDWMK